MIFDEEYEMFLGAHMLGNKVTEMIVEIVLA
jgi:pyruvate/2-oxoglutarate dehydrogenase complex dihydrolipoamide dehydrogenase (E3) component